MERKKLHEKVLYPVVRVIAKKAMGSGTILYSKPSETVPNEYETYVLTNCHVVEDSISYKKEWDALLKRDVKKEILDAVQVQEFRYYTGRSVVVGESSVQADIVAYDKTQDLALLKARDVKRYEYVAEMFPRDGKLEMLMELLCVGCGMGERPLMTYGFLSGMNREIDNYPYHLSSANSVFGNCLPGDTLISMHDGTVKKLSDIKVGDYVLAYGEVASGLTNARVEELIESGEKTVYRIRTRNRELYASGNHPVVRITPYMDFAGRIRNIPQWVQVSELSEGDIITVMSHHIPRDKGTGLRFADVIGQDKNPLDLMMFLGFFTGDGYKRRRTHEGGEVQLYPYNETVGRKYKEIIETLFGVNVTVLGNWDQLRVSSVALVNILDKLGFSGKAKDKVIPDWVFKCTPDKQIAFIQGYAEADGYTDKHGAWVFEAASEDLIRQLRLMAIHLGIQVSNIHHRSRMTVPPNANGVEYEFESWSFQAYPSYSKETNCYIAGDKSLLPDDLQYARIAKIEEVGVQPVYDIRLDARHAFFANGVLVHNSGGAVFEKESMQFVGVPSRITVSLFGQAITHMGYFIPVDRVYKFLDEQMFEFIYDPTQTPSACAKRREEKREKDRIFAANVSEESEK